MTFSGSLRSSFREFVKVVAHPFPLVAALLVLHLFMPLAAWSLGHLVFAGDAYTITGIVLAAAIPTGITSLMWVAIYRGSVVLTLSIILADTLLAPFVVPYTLSLLVGAQVTMDTWAIMKGLLYMIVLPSLLGMLLNQLTAGNAHRQWSARLAPFSKVAMGLVIALNGAVVAPYLKHLNAKLLAIAVFVLFVAALGYVFGWLAAKLMRWDREIAVALTFNGGMRNISAGAVLAVSFFPAPVAIPVVLCMLFQQTLASIFGFLLHQDRQPQTRTNV
jgi:predicted Na+-dependent transporter